MSGHVSHLHLLAVVASMSEIDLAERIAAALPRDWPSDYRVHGDRPSTCVTCGNVFKGNPRRTECRVCKDGHHTIEDIK